MFKQFKDDEKGYGTGELMVIFVGLAGLALAVSSYLLYMFTGSIAPPTEPVGGLGGVLGNVEGKIQDAIN